MKQRPAVPGPAAGCDQGPPFEAVLTQRYANGLTGHFAFSTNRVTENRTVNEFDREPTLWQTNNNGRPWRVTGAGVYELPFGPGRAFLDNGGVLAPSRADGASAAPTSTSRARC